MQSEATMTHQDNPFDERAAEYDAWFESECGRAVFAQELECLRRVMLPATGRWLEVGVGTGRFAAALGVAEGIDPSDSIRALAEGRGVKTANAVGERLPYADETFDGLLMTTTLCFLADPETSLRESHRVLRNTGCLVVGVIPEGSSWWRHYACKVAEGHPIYSAATFHTPDEVIGLASGVGFSFQTGCSCLLTPPESLCGAEQPHEGTAPEAGFVAMGFTKGRLASTYRRGS